MTDIKAVLVILSLLLILGFSSAIVDIKLPVPEKNTENNIIISANEEAEANGAITVTNKELAIELQNIEIGKNFFIGVNKDLASKISSMPKSNQTQKNPPYDYIKDQLGTGITIKVENIEQTETKSFAITNWDGKNPIKISFCQDKDENDECKGENEAATAQISFQEQKIIIKNCTTTHECTSIFGQIFAQKLFN